jgi:hypothetical protein
MSAAYPCVRGGACERADSTAPISLRRFALGRVERVRIEADCLGSASREYVERGIGGRRSPARLRGPTRPNQFGSNEALYVERWKAVGNLLGRLPKIADELEHVAISVFHTTTVLVRGRLRARTVAFCASTIPARGGDDRVVVLAPAMPGCG